MSQVCQNHVEVRHPSCLPLQAPTGQNCLMSPSASTFSEENHHGRTLMESRAETRPCFRLQVISPKLKLAHQRQRVSNFCEVQVPGSGNPTCERSGLRTSFGHPHQAPVTRSSPWEPHPHPEQGSLPPGAWGSARKGEGNGARCPEAVGREGHTPSRGHAFFSRGSSPNDGPLPMAQL